MLVLSSLPCQHDCIGCLVHALYLVDNGLRPNLLWGLGPGSLRGAVRRVLRHSSRGRGRGLHSKFSTGQLLEHP